MVRRANREQGRGSKRLLDRRGMSAVEILTAASIGLVVMGGFAAFHRQELRTLSLQSKQLQLQGTARSFVDLLARDLRRADELSLVVQQNGIRIGTDINHNGAIGAAGDSPDEDVIYSFAADAVRRRAGGPDGTAPTEDLLTGVDSSGVTLRFVDRDGNELSFSDAAQLPNGPDGVAGIRRVRLAFPVRATSGPTGSDVRPQAEIVTDVTLRKRFFLTSPNGSADAAVYADFNIDSFLNSLDNPGGGGEPACRITGSPCSTGSQCCSGRCRQRGSCR